MTWLPIDQTTASERAAVLGLHPAAHAAQERFLARCRAAFDAGLIDLCTAHMAQSLRCREALAAYDDALLQTLGRWDQCVDFSPLQRDALAFVEQFILDPALIDAGVIGGLERELGSEGVINFAAVIAALEASLRLSTLLDLEPAR